MNILEAIEQMEASKICENDANEHPIIFRIEDNEIVHKVKNAPYGWLPTELEIGDIKANWRVV